jgi:hypothetical protein
MKRLMHSLKSQSIGVLALFIALGGTGYAAINLPRNSVGTRQIRNGAVTANKLGKGSITSTKLNGSSIPGYVAFWAQIASNGQVTDSSKPATTTGWSGGIGEVTFHGALPRNCFPLANIGGGQGPGAHVGFAVSGSQGGSTSLSIAMLTNTGAVGPESLDVAEICP